MMPGNLIRRPGRRVFLGAAVTLLAALGAHWGVRTNTPVDLYVRGLVQFHAAVLVLFLFVFTPRRAGDGPSSAWFGLLAAQPLAVFFVGESVAAALSVIPVGAVIVLLALRKSARTVGPRASAPIPRTGLTARRYLAPAAALIAAGTSAVVWCPHRCEWPLAAAGVFRLVAFAAVFLATSAAPWSPSTRRPLTAAVAMLPAGVTAVAAATGAASGVAAHWAIAAADLWVCGTYGIYAAGGLLRRLRFRRTRLPLPPRGRAGRADADAIRASDDVLPPSSERSSSCSGETRSSSPARRCDSSVPAHP